MIITKLQFSNFRNFKGDNEIVFNNDENNITLIYGSNGSGKTTLHQLFQWILYGAVKFNNTSNNDVLYNLQLENEAQKNEIIKVHGRIEFYDLNDKGEKEFYSAHRVQSYIKKTVSTDIYGSLFTITKKVDDDWKKVDDPNALIERMIPQGLSQYFFFDGENMIADLYKKGRESAKQLKSSLYSILGLNVYEQAKVHIGSKTQSQTVLGNLYLSKPKSEAAADAEEIALKGKINRYQGTIVECDREIKEANEKICKCDREIKNLSESIGKTKSREELEKQRKKKQCEIERFKRALETEQKNFGSALVKIYPYLLMSKVIADAQNRIALKVADEQLPLGVTPQLIETLIKEKECICGNKIGEKEIEHLKGYLKMFPPYSYKETYDLFKREVKTMASNKNDVDSIDAIINNVIDYSDSIVSLENEIHVIDNDKKNSEDIQVLIDERAAKEDERQDYDAIVQAKNGDRRLAERYLKQFTNDFDKYIEKKGADMVVVAEIGIMETVLDYFNNKLSEVSEKYSAELKKNIQELINKMLTSKRTVSMTKDFELKVYDSFGDESKSEGQFAVTSFAYIGGIMKLLKTEEKVQNKQFPLVMDGPFSKLDPIQRKNVIDVIPNYAPQIILFSKDDITDSFDRDITNNVWTIECNDEKNVASVKKGYFKEVFSNDGNNE